MARKFVEVSISNSYFGSFTQAMFLQETEKAYLLRGRHPNSEIFYKPKWIPKRFVTIISELFYCFIHKVYYKGEICPQCFEFLQQTLEKEKKIKDQSS